MLIELSDLDTSSEHSMSDIDNGASKPPAHAHSSCSHPDQFDPETFIFGSDSGSIEVGDTAPSMTRISVPEHGMLSYSDVPSDCGDESDSYSETSIFPRLSCCKNEQNLPKLVVCANSKFYHANCFSCSICRNQIRPPGCFATSVRQHGDTILCTECAERLERRRKVCQVCHRQIEDTNAAVQLKPGFFLHPNCLHCECCSRTPEKARDFSICEGKDKSFVLCSDCISIMNGNGTPAPTDMYIGRFIKDILPINFVDRCQRCSGRFKNLGFMFQQQRILCVDCGLQVLQTQK